MSIEKLLSILSYEWLPKTGDSEKLLIKFLIEDASLSDQRKLEPQAIIIKVSRSLMTVWKNSDSRYLEQINLEKILLHFALLIIKGRVQSNVKLLPDEIIELTTYSNFVLPDLDTLQSSLGQTEAIYVEKKFGFLQ